MRKQFFFYLVLFFIPVFSFSQLPNIQVRGKGSALYLEHKVNPKENFYSISRMYNVAPRELAAYNKLSMDKGLSIGQVIRVPLDKDNFTQTESKSVAEALIPIYHLVEPSETLFRVGANYSNVPLARLKEWNHLQGDQLKAGSSLIVGFLRVSKADSPLAAMGDEKPTKTIEETAKKEDPSPVKASVPAKVPAVKEEPAKETKSENVIPRKPEVVKENQPTILVKNESAETVGNDGFFKDEFNQLTATGTSKSLSGAGSVFKSTSGWEDKKYYCFTNQATPGSVVKVEVSGGSKAIYAKVLDAIPDIKQNEGVKIVLSNAGADALGVSGEKFEAVITYFK